MVYFSSITGSSYNGVWDSWYGPGGRDYVFNFSLIENSPTNRALELIGKATTKEKMIELRNQATLQCTPPTTNSVNCKPLIAPCLFDIEKDPCETNNVADM